MEKTALTCTAPGCGKALEPKAAWLPELAAMRRAHGGRVQVADFGKFALCGRCGHLLRKEKVRVYRYLDTVERELGREKERETQALAFRPFAERFAQKAKPKARRPGGDGRNVGGGLSLCAKKDAEKRPTSAQVAESADPIGATKPPAAS